MHGSMFDGLGKVVGFYAFVIFLAGLAVGWGVYHFWG